MDENTDDHNPDEERIHEATEPSSSSGRCPCSRPLSRGICVAPVVITKDSSNALHSYVREIDSGENSYECLVGFVRPCCYGVSVLSGGGVVTDMMLRQPTAKKALLQTFDNFCGYIVNFCVSFCQLHTTVVYMLALAIYISFLNFGLRICTDLNHGFSLENYGRLMKKFLLIFK